jgi:hypothetical protein
VSQANGRSSGTAKEAQQALDETRANIKHGIVVNDRLPVGR